MLRRSAKKKNPTPWEITKPLLAEEIKANEVTDNMHPEIVHVRKREYEAVPIQNLKTNLRALRKRIRIDRARAVR
jgi:hypothetical protein